MKRKVQEHVLRTVMLGVAGFGALVLVVPEWARDGVLLFAALYTVLVVAIDPGVRAFFSRREPAKSPASRRAAT
jgi:hypothetical protein